MQTKIFMETNPDSYREQGFNLKLDNENILL